MLAALAAAPAAASLPPERVAEAVRVHVSDRLGVPLSDVEVAHLGIGRPLACPADATIDIETSSTESFAGRSDVRIVARAGGGICDRLHLRPRVEIWIQVPVAATPVSAGDRVELAQGRVRRQTIQGVPVGMGGGDWLARAPLAPGDPVTLTNARRAPDEHSGHAVKLQASRGAVQLEVRGRLMSDANIGDTVQVVNTATGVVVRGTLIEPGVVQAGAKP